VVFQSQSLDRKLTVRENMDSQGRLFGLSGTILRERIDEALVRLGLADRASDLVATLSGGLKRRVEIAKALLHKPSVLLMDEPSTGLDPSVRFELWKHLEELRVRESVTILVTTHILEEAERCDQLLMLHQGRVVRAGTPADLTATVGGDVLDLGARHAAELYARLTEHFAVLPLRMNGRLRLEVPEGDRFLARILTAFPGLVDSVSLRKPTLEDVFLSETGSRLGE
jgi:ABC-2 type transport system ATP-binding protein